MIYLDHHAATPLSEAVRTAMLRAHDTAWANPASVHGAGRAAKAQLEQARRGVAAALSAQAADVVFTGGATEACNLALQGYARAARSRIIVTTQVEHPAISATCDALEREGYEIRRLPVLHGAPPAPAVLRQALADGAAAVAIQWVNHETGTVFPIADYAEVCTQLGAPLVVDACQALGKVTLSVVGLSALVVSGAKVGAPPGSAALWLERCAAMSELIHGGAQERGRRPGTPDVAAQAGFAAACRALPGRLADMNRLAGLRDRLEQACIELGAVVNAPEGRVATVTNVSFRAWRADMLVPALDLEGLCASSGAACSSGVGEPSPVLRAMYPEEPWRAESALRLSLGPEVTEAEAEAAIAILRRVIPRARA